MIKTQTFIFDLTDDESRDIVNMQNNELIDILNKKGIQWKTIEYFEINKYRITIFIWKENHDR